MPPAGTEAHAREANGPLVDVAVPLGLLDAPDLREAALEDPAEHVLGVAAPLDLLDDVLATKDVHDLERLHVTHDEAIGRRARDEPAIRREVHQPARLLVRRGEVQLRQGRGHCKGLAAAERHRFPPTPPRGRVSIFDHLSFRSQTTSTANMAPRYITTEGSAVNAV